MSSTRIFADDTTLPVLDPGRGRTKTGRVWGYVIDDRPWQGSTPPAVVYLYAEDRKGEHPAAHLAGFQGILQVDGYSGYKNLLENRNRRLSATLKVSAGRIRPSRQAQLLTLTRRRALRCAPGAVAAELRRPDGSRARRRGP
jgi:hypothetical protein